MPVVFAYLFKLTITVAMVYLFYRVALQRLTFYTCNRWYLLVYSLMAFFIPFIDITPAIQQQHLGSTEVVLLIPVLQVHTSEGTSMMQQVATAPGRFDRAIC